jgi:iron complex outermembrane receptor protein
MKNSFAIILCLVLLLLIPFAPGAQEKEVTLEGVVVTGTRDVQEIRKIPANVTVITREEIAQSNSQTTIDLVRSEVGVTIRDWFGNVKRAEVDIRGFGETGLLNTLVLVDGRRVNAIDLSGVDWTQIPIDQVERIEIVRGAGSVLYGDNAVGGVINIITKKPEKPFSGKVEGLVGSYHFNKESGSVSGKWGPLSAVLNASYNATEGYRENGFLRAKDVGGKLIYELNQDISLNFSGAFHNDDAGLPGGLTKADMNNLGRRATLNPDNEASTEDGYGAIGVKVKLWGWGRMETDLSYRHRNMESFLDFPAYFYTYEDKRISKTWGVTPKYILEKPLFTFHNKLIFGCDFYDSDAEVDWKDIVFGCASSNQSEITKRSTGLYLLDEFSILENLILSLGYRHEWASYDISRQTPILKDKIRDDEPAWNVGLDYLFGKRSSAFFSIKRSFRFPVSDEFFVIDLNTFELKINSALKPQTGYHYEAGIRHAFNDQIEANLTLFWMDFRNEIFLNPETLNNENFPKTRRQGIEIGMKATPFEWLSLWGNYGYIRPRLRGDSSSGNDIPGVARHKGSIGTDIRIWKGLQLNGRALFVDSRYLISDFANQVDRLGGYYTVDAKLSYLWKGLKAFIGVNNLFNRKYAEYAVTNATGTAQSFYPSTVRNYLCGISYNF